jgi:hypothetical protein
MNAINDPKDPARTYIHDWTEDDITRDYLDHRDEEEDLERPEEDEDLYRDR